MRARNIKPGFFKNEDLAECSPLARILFAGLWCYGDREGRFEWRPKRIKVELIPYDDADVDRLLEELLNRRFITFYSQNGQDYGCVNSFIKHQNPHINERASILPEPNEHSTSTVQAPDKHSSNHADSLIPDSLIPELTLPNGRESELSVQTCPHQKIRELYNANCKSLPALLKMSKQRKSRLKTRWGEHPDLNWWAMLFEQVEATPFCCGDNDRGWKASFDWLIANDTNALKVLEGKYADGEKPKKSDGLTGCKKCNVRATAATMDLDENGVCWGCRTRDSNT